MTEKIYYSHIYNAINSAADFSYAESWDNSGGLVRTGREIKKILTALDITKEVALEAVKVKADLVVSHHPVIFKGLKFLDENEPAVILAKNDIGAICAHTNADIAPDGLNDYLCKTLGFKAVEGLPLAVEEGKGIGKVCDLERDFSAKELALYLKEKLGCKTVRYSDCKKTIRRVGICSGSGGDFLFEAVKKDCDGLITGDVKHNFFVSSNNIGISIFDAGHYYTEVIFSGYITEILKDAFPKLEISRAQSDFDPCDYV